MLSEEVKRKLSEEGYGLGVWIEGYLWKSQDPATPLILGRVGAININAVSVVQSILRYDLPKVKRGVRLQALTPRVLGSTGKESVEAAIKVLKMLDALGIKGIDIPSVFPSKRLFLLGCPFIPVEFNRSYPYTVQPAEPPQFLQEQLGEPWISGEQR